MEMFSRYDVPLVFENIHSPWWLDCGYMLNVYICLIVVVLTCPRPGFAVHRYSGINAIALSFMSSGYVALNHFRYV